MNITIIYNGKKMNLENLTEDITINFDEMSKNSFSNKNISWEKNSYVPNENNNYFYYDKQKLSLSNCQNRTKKYSEEEISFIVNALNNGVSISEISNILHRTYFGIMYVRQSMKDKIVNKVNFD